MRKYKTTGNTTLFDKENTERKLTEEQRAANREKSRTRSRVEHIFGFMENTTYIRTNPQKMSKRLVNAYLCSGLKGLPKRDFGILTTQKQVNQV